MNSINSDKRTFFIPSRQIESIFPAILFFLLKADFVPIARKQLLLNAGCCYNAIAITSEQKLETEPSVYKRQILINRLNFFENIIYNGKLWVLFKQNSPQTGMVIAKIENLPQKTKFCNFLCHYFV